MSLRDELARALALENETERKLAVVSLIGAQAQRMGWRAIVIGPMDGSETFHGIGWPFWLPWKITSHATPSWSRSRSRVCTSW